MPSDEVLIEEIAKYAASGYPNAPAAAELPLTVAVWHEVLADLTDGEVREACRRHRRSDDPGDRFWPIPARIRALSDPGRFAASLGTDADCDKAWARFHRRMLDLLPDGPVSPADLHPVEAHGAALWAGLKAMGGIEAFRMSKPDDPWPVKAWKAGYREERRRQASEPREVRAMLAATQAPRMLESGK